MYIVESFLDAPMRPVAGSIAQTIERCEDADRQIEIFECKVERAEAKQKAAEEEAKLADMRATGEVKTVQRRCELAVARADELADTNAKLRKAMDLHNENARLRAENALLRAGVVAAPSATGAA